FNGKKPGTANFSCSASSNSSLSFTSGILILPLINLFYLEVLLSIIIIFMNLVFKSPIFKTDCLEN
ncbi:MAG: hypothetical protein SPK49_07665, partial [Erysipelotrichaceae bacterium]|nr:hypothetical protein [Erysipelotrichaceae bacterium]